MRALIALLAAHHDTPLPRAWVAATLWPDTTEEEARANLRRHLHLLAKALPGSDEAYVHVTKETVRWSPAAPIDVDAILFDRALAEGRWADAAAHYAGPFLSDAYEEWVEPVRERYAAEAIRALTHAVDEARARGERDLALAHAERLLAIDPWREEAVRDVIALRAACGDRAGASHAFHSFAERVRAQLGAEPDGATVAAYRAALYDPSHADPHDRALPVPRHELLGRTNELAALRAALGAHRCVSVVGGAGVGKTRLALQLARRDAGVVRWVELADVGEGDDLTLAIARSAGHAGRAGLATAIAVLRDVGLLVLDNAEHVADATCRLVDALGEALPALRIVVTTRRALGAHGEHVLRLGALPVPPDDPAAALDEIRRSPAVQLFVERAAAAHPDVRLHAGNARLIAGIVRRLDGVPLALELAAARATMLTLDGIAKRLEDEFRLVRAGGRGTRQSTIDAAIDWSTQLLSADERALLAQLSVFASAPAFTDIEAVCTLAATDVFDALSELVEASLVEPQRGAGEAVRYRLLEATRAHARERLRDAPDRAATELAHARWCAARCDELREAYGAYATPAYRAAAAALDADAREVLRRCATSGDVALGAHIVAAMRAYWTSSAVDQRHVDDIEALLRAGGDDTVRAWLHDAIAGIVASRDWRRSERHAARALELYRAAGDERGAARALYTTAHGPFARGEQEKAAAVLRDAAAAFERAGDDHGLMLALTNLAAPLIALGRCDEAEPLARRALAFFEPRDPYPTGTNLNNLSLIAWLRGEFAAALQLAERAAAAYRASGAPFLEADVTVKSSMILRSLGRFDDALDAALAALQLALSDKRNTANADALDEIVQCFEASGRHADAALLSGTAETHRLQCGRARQQGPQQKVLQTEQRLRFALGARFEELRARGTLLRLEEARELARRDAGGTALELG
ncbi:MAG TPA: BTAD domain-containing putative transcriptional regulator [Candidatus Baltobacteraceae bacterium]|nr:BTAD domain-containing putative transcriptional regulator [Candidatus Baltobacteraceae bacterium]